MRSLRNLRQPVSVLRWFLLGLLFASVGTASATFTPLRYDAVGNKVTRPDATAVDQVGQASSLSRAFYRQTTEQENDFCLGAAAAHSHVVGSRNRLEACPIACAQFKSVGGLTFDYDYVGNGCCY